MPTRKPRVIHSPSLTAAHRAARIEVLARDMLIAGISSTGVGVPSGDDIRQVVRNARTFYSEVDYPTKPKTVVKRAPREGEEEEDTDEGLSEGAEVELEEEL